MYGKKGGDFLIWDIGLLNTCRSEGLYAIYIKIEHFGKSGPLKIKFSANPSIGHSFHKQFLVAFRVLNTKDKKNHVSLINRMGYKFLPFSTVVVIRISYQKKMFYIPIKLLLEVPTH